MPSLPELHTLIDFGMCVVLWLVQLVIYPSFLRIAEDQLVAWHRAYTFRVSFVIMPLMLAQLALAAWAVVDAPAALNWLILTLVLICWCLTFVISVPLHRRIDMEDPTAAFRRQLILTNWPRTALWTLIFVLGIFR